MGQAWCKEKSSKAQDSKSPLDRVFVRCAHRIYPSLKEEASVLGATQRVTSSEIGYALAGAGEAAGRAGPRALQRGHSIDSVDRPFHPSEWVDVNLEVPCTPRSSVVLSGSKNNGCQQRARMLAPSLEDGQASTRDWETGEEEEEEEGVPVPPPRRRRRRSRSRRSLPGDAADDESETEPEPLSSPRAADEAGNSDDEFVEIEKSLLKEEATGSGEPAGPKSASAASLASAAELEETGAAVARRPPRQKTSSFREPEPRASPERTPAARRRRRRSASSNSIDDDLGEGWPEGNSIFKSDASPEKEAQEAQEAQEERDAADDDTLMDAKTSTPVKAGESAAPAEFEPQSLDDAFESFSKQQSSPSRDSSAEEVPVAQDVDRPARSEDDGGYESKNSTRLFLESERSFVEEPSSGISADAAADSAEPVPLIDLADEELPGLVVIQRTISEESLPREMLVEELDEDEEQQPRPADAQGPARPAEADRSQTPPPSPEPKSPEVSTCIANGFVDVAREDLEAEEEEEEEEEERVEEPLTATPVAGVGPGSEVDAAPPSATELEAALADVLEKGDEPSRPLQRTNPFLDPAGQLFSDFSFPGKREALLAGEPNSPAEYNVDEPPEKPKRVERVDGLIEEALIVPTPPRRRNRSRSNLNSSAEPEALHTYASRDRLI